MLATVVNILNNPTIISALITALVTFLITKSTNKKDISINDRLQLSKDEQEYRKELKETLNDYRTGLNEANKQIAELQELVSQLREANLTISLERRQERNQLEEKIDRLTSELMKFKGEVIS